MKNHRDIIGRVASRILSDWAMMLVEPAVQSMEVFETDMPFYQANIQFRGPFTGVYVVLCQLPFIETLSENLLGSESSISDEEKEDSIKEMINVLTGNFLTECFGSDLVFDVVLPKVERISSAEAEKFIDEQAVLLRADEHPLCLTFRLEDEHAN